MHGNKSPHAYLDILSESVITYGTNAAHERTDINVTDEMRKHDDKIMNDDSEWE